MKESQTFKICHIVSQKVRLISLGRMYLFFLLDFGQLIVMPAEDLEG